VPVRSGRLVDLAALPSSSADSARDDESSQEEPVTHVFDLRRVKLEKLRTPKTPVSAPARSSPPKLRFKARIYRAVPRNGKEADVGHAKRKLVFDGVAKSPKLRAPSRKRLTRAKLEELLAEVHAATASVERQIAAIKTHTHMLQRETDAMVAHTEKVRAAHARTDALIARLKRQD
jgi:hypothetical protein